MEKETLTSMPDNEDILAYARKHYPIGTEYIHLDNNGIPHARERSTITRDPRFYGGRDYIEGGHGFIYCKDKWAEIINEVEEEERMETQRLSRQGLKEIHSVACDAWKEILEKYGANNPLEDYIELTKPQVDTMFNSCTKEQLPIVSKYLKQDDGSINVTKFKCEIYNEDGCAIIEKRFDGEYAYKSLLLDDVYDWEIKKDSKDKLCLIPTKKKPTTSYEGPYAYGTNSYAYGTANGVTQLVGSNTATAGRTV